MVNIWVLVDKSVLHRLQMFHWLVVQKQCREWWQRHSSDFKTEKKQTKVVVGSEYSPHTCTDTHFYSHHNAFFFDDSWKRLSTAVFLIESLVEKYHSPNALVDGSIRREEYLSKSTAILLCVLHIDPLQPVPHGT